MFDSKWDQVVRQAVRREADGMNEASNHTLTTMVRQIMRQGAGQGMVDGTPVTDTLVMGQGE